MVTLEIITLKATPLPDILGKLFQTWNVTHTSCHEVYAIELDYLGDEHISPLNRAYEEKQIAFWACIGARRDQNEVESVSDYVADITMN
jgi:hypothetical protein